MVVSATPSLAAFLWVFLGGGIGSVCRYTIGIFAQPYAPRFPWATFIVNGAACIVLGALLAWQAEGRLDDRYRLLLATGFCGGFSTYSTFTAENWQLMQDGQILIALLNIFMHLCVCFLCLFLGMKIGT